MASGGGGNRTVRAADKHRTHSRSAATPCRTPSDQRPTPNGSNARRRRDASHRPLSTPAADPLRLVAAIHRTVVCRPEDHEQRPVGANRERGTSIDLELGGHFDGLHATAGLGDVDTSVAPVCDQGQRYAEHLRYGGQLKLVRCVGQLRVVSGGGGWVR